jgi:anaerobic magnesium-protoporphyrin IX monomethyl ester cyclase
MVLQGRPKALYRTYLHPDRGLRHAMRWYSQMGRRVWPYEIVNFFRDPLVRSGPTVRQFWGAPQDAEEESMAAGRPAQSAGGAHQFAFSARQSVHAVAPAGPSRN